MSIETSIYAAYNRRMWTSPATPGELRPRILTPRIYTRTKSPDGTTRCCVKWEAEIILSFPICFHEPANNAVREIVRPQPQQAAVSPRIALERQTTARELLSVLLRHLTVTMRLCIAFLLATPLVTAFVTNPSLANVDVGGTARDESQRRHVCHERHHRR